MDNRVCKLITVLVCFGFVLSGCAYFAARDEIKSAETLLTQLQAQGGQKYTPYEYCSAEKFLEISRLEFGQNDFNDAKRFAGRSKSAAEAGLAEIKKVKK
jgi:hypothetical protein